MNLPKYDFGQFYPSAILVGYACIHIQSKTTGKIETIELTPDEAERLKAFFNSIAEPACAVPFAYVPGRKVVEKFTVQIETPETCDYCSCARCRSDRIVLWRAIIYAQVSNRLKEGNPFKVSDGHKITVVPDEHLNLD